LERAADCRGIVRVADECEHEQPDQAEDGQRAKEQFYQWDGGVHRFSLADCDFGSFDSEAAACCS